MKQKSQLVKSFTRSGKERIRSEKEKIRKKTCLPFTDCLEIRSAERNIAVAILPVYIGRETPWFQVVVRVTAIVSLVAKVTEAVGEGGLAVPALTRVACLRHALSTVVLGTPQIGVWETLQGRRHCKVLYQFSLLLNNLHNIFHATKI